jgi:hypothetical protein
MIATMVDTVDDVGRERFPGRGGPAQAQGSRQAALV